MTGFVIVLLAVFVSGLCLGIALGGIAERYRWQQQVDSEERRKVIRDMLKGREDE